MTELPTIPLAVTASSETRCRESIDERVGRLRGEIEQLGVDMRADVEAKRAAFDSAVARASDVEDLAAALQRATRSARRSRVQGRIDFASRPPRDGMI